MQQSYTPTYQAPVVMNIHFPHFKPIQRAVLRNVLGAVLCLVLAIILIILMAILLVFPAAAWSQQVALVDRPIYANLLIASPTVYFLDA